MSGIGRRAARGAFATVGGQGVRFLLQVASFVVLSRFLSPSQFGIFAMVLAIAGVAAILGDFGLSSATVQSQTVTRTQLNNVFWLNLLFGTALTGLVVALADPIASFYDQPDVASVCRVISVIFLLNAATLQFRAQAMRELRFVLLALADVVAQTLGFIVAIAMAANHGGVWSLVGQQIVASAVPLVVLVASLKWLPGRPGRAPMRQIVSFAGNVTGVQVINYVVGNMDTALVGKFWGAGPAGLYSRAFQLIMLPIQLAIGPVGRVALPILSRLVGQPSFERRYQQLQLATSYIATGALTLVAAFTYPGTDLGFGPGWERTKLLTLILVAGGAFEAASYPLSWLYTSTNNTRVLLRLTLVIRPVMVGLIVAGAVAGPEWTAAAVTLGFLINWIGQFRFGVRAVGLDWLPMLRATARPMWAYGLVLALISPVTWLNGTWSSLWLQVAAIAVVLPVAAALVMYAIPSVRSDVRLVFDTLRMARGPRRAESEAAI
jgi:O-antigen/teichoic acid export membrane protein